MFKTKYQTVPTRRCSVFDYFPIYHLLIISIPDLELLAVYVKQGIPYFTHCLIVFLYIIY